MPRSVPHPDATRAFAQFVTGEDGRAIMEQYGFLTINN
ncbi:MAG: substrate-binding domain-containing protein [Anaerolineae bacterium]